MEKKNMITAPQMFSLLFLCNIILGVTYNLPMAQSSSTWDHALSALFVILFNFVIFIPNYKLYKLNKNMNIIDNCITKFNKFGKILSLIYIIYCVFIFCYLLSLFDIFVKDTATPNVSVFLLNLCIILASLYTVHLGIEGLARAGSIILFIVCVAIIFLILSLVFKINMLNFYPLLFNNSSNFFNGFLYLSSLTIYIPVMNVIYPFVKGKIKTVFNTVTLLTYLLFVISIIFVTGILGDYASTQIFPIYCVTKVAELDIFKRLDALYLGIFTAGLFITISLFLFTLFVIIKKVFGENRKKSIVIIVLATVLAISTILSIFKNAFCIFYNTNFMFWLTLCVSFFIPILVLCKHKKQIKGEIKK